MNINLATIKLIKAIDTFVNEIKIGIIPYSSCQAIFSKSIGSDNINSLINGIVYDDRMPTMISTEYYYKKRRYNIIDYINDDNSVTYTSLDACGEIYLEISKHKKTGEVIREIVINLFENDARIVIEEDGSWFIDD